MKHIAEEFVIIVGQNKQESTMLAITLPSDIEQRVNQVIHDTDYSAKEFVRQAVLNYLEQKEAKCISNQAFEDFVAMVSSRELDSTFIEAVEEIQNSSQQERDWSVFE